MISFKSFIIEAWTNEIGKSSKEASVTNKMKYSSGEEYKKGANKIGEINGLHIYTHDSNGGMTVFTHNPKDGHIHHVVHAVQKTGPNHSPTLKFLSAHKRDGSPASMGSVYAHLIKKHNFTFVGTGHSPGAQKMWDRFHDDSEIEVLGRHPDGTTVKLNRGDKKYASKKTKDPNELKIGRMELIARKK